MEIESQTVDEGRSRRSMPKTLFSMHSSVKVAFLWVVVQFRPSASILFPTFAALLCLLCSQKAFNRKVREGMPQRTQRNQTAPLRSCDLSHQTGVDRCRTERNVIF
jgi:hypothetical protein